MTKKHDAIFDAVLSGLDADERSPKKDRSAGRFLKRGNAIGEKLSGEVHEKTPALGRSRTLQNVGPSQ